MRQVYLKTTACGTSGAHRSRSHAVKPAALATGLIVVATLAACGTGGDTNSVDASPPPGPPAAASPVVMLGDTRDWVFTPASDFSETVDGSTAAVSNPPNAGDVAELQGVQSPGGELLADSVSIEHILDGPVDSIDLQHAQLVVLGLTVTLRPGTHLYLTGEEGTVQSSGSDLEQLRPGDRITVSGQVTLSGQVQATRLARSSEEGNYLVTAFAGTVDSNAHTVRIGSLLIDYSEARLRGFPGEGLQAGQRLRVRGVLAATDNFAAAEVSYLSTEWPHADHTQVSIRGLVTAVKSPTGIEIDGHAVELGSGLCAGLNELVSVTGIGDSSGRVVAATAYLDADVASVGVSGPVTAVDSLFAVYTVLGFSVQTSLTTSYSYDACAATGQFQMGEMVSASGGAGPKAGVVLATQLNEAASDDSTGVTVAQGYYSVADPYAIVAGRPIEITDATTFVRFMGHMDRQTFLAAPVPDDGDPVCNYNLFFKIVPGTESAPVAQSVEFIRYADC